MSSSRLKVLQATAWYPPFHLGGTEIYLEGLVGELASFGVESAVVAPRAPGMPESYVHAGTEVETYPVNEVAARNELRSGKPHLGFEAFLACLSRHRGAIYHQHSWSRGCGLHHLRAAHEAGLRTVLSVHVPGNICLRGTMLRYGAEPCDGHVDEKICGACWAQQRGMPKIIAEAIAEIPIGAAKLVRHFPHRLASGLAARALGAEKRSQLRDMLESADRIIAVCGWLHDALAANNVPSDKLVLNRQGASGEYMEAVQAIPRVRDDGAPLRLLYLGRWDRVKGIDVVVRALRSLPDDAHMQLTIHAIPGGPDARAYETQVRELAGSDPRISFEAPIPRERLASTLSHHDVLVVPSLWLETGPLVVLEAQAAGLFVLGSRMGGIAELVDEGESGELVEAGDVVAWSRAIARLSRKRFAGPMPRVMRHVRTISEVAAEMAALYRTL